MPDIGNTIRTITLADSTVSGLVSTRMYADALIQKATLPAIVYHVISTAPNEHLAGIVNVSQARIQIDAHAKTRSAANSLADAIRLALEKKNRGLNGTQFINEINLASGERHLFDPAQSGSDKRRPITTQDFAVSYRTTTS